ncbi:sensor domain-containing diguanylate cyclase [Natronospirillum operosum]|uniref:Sensor domain-containing diguanylate cyclase n=1 Tax=Natronospirillum operosum TaxID=2759953 RepID=A0A4Z0WAU3_9GAMM|nr:sensor domain-containing diguanylate cyclase [Natronospirillum operosum]TGG91531.1 sensor domain-containing diguanylate cyclase [Natronospirillum operosum]
MKELISDPSASEQLQQTSGPPRVWRRLLPAAVALLLGWLVLLWLNAPATAWAGITLTVLILGTLALWRQQKVLQSLYTAQDRMARQLDQRARQLADNNRQLTTEMRLKDAFTEALRQNDQKLQMAMQASQLAVWDWDIRGRHLHISGPEQGFGQLHNGVMRPLSDYVHPDDFARVRRTVIRHLRGITPRLTLRYRNREEPPRWLEDTGRTIAFDEKQRPQRLLGTRRDITAEVEREQELTLAASLFSDNRDPLLVLDRDFNVSALNPAFAEMLRRSADEWRDRPWVRCSHSRLTHDIVTRLREQGHWEGELLEQRSNGEAFPLHLSFRSVMTGNLVSHYLGFGRDLSQQRQARQTQDKGHYDPLTGLPNRSYFYQQLDYYRRMDRLPEQQVALGLLNIDAFRAINETHGHATGDLLLQDIAARLNQYGAPLLMVARLGGGHFGLLFSHFETSVRLRHLADQIVADIHRPMLLDDQDVLPSVSMGLLMLNPENVHECLNATGIALEQAKHRGGNRVVEAGDLHRSPDARKAESLQALQQILDCLETPLRFRPQVEGTHGELRGIRVSTVLAYAELGEQLADPLYALAQEKQLEERLYRQLLREACACHVRCARSAHKETLLLSFPLNSRLVFNEHLREMTATVLDEFNIPPALLELSFPARVLQHDRTLVMAQLNALHRTGFRLALEDVEAWPVTLSQCLQLPLTRLRMAVGEPGQMQLLAGISQSLNWELCVVRVNSYQDLESIRSLSPSRLEGEQVGHTLDVDDLETFVRHYRPPTEQPRLLH